MSLDISDLDMELAEISLVPDLDKCAILLDIDGTILDIAPAPQEVWVPPALRHTLGRLQELTGGAVALVSGRPLDDIDLIFAPPEQVKELADFVDQAEDDEAEVPEPLEPRDDLKGSG